MEVIIGIVIGVVIGFIFKTIFSRPKTIGILRVDRSDPEDGPYLFLELSSEEAAKSIKHNDYVTFKVDTTNYISQN